MKGMEIAAQMSKHTNYKVLFWNFIIFVVFRTLRTNETSQYLSSMFFAS